MVFEAALQTGKWMERMVHGAGMGAAAGVEGMEGDTPSGSKFWGDVPPEFAIF